MLILTFIVVLMSPSLAIAARTAPDTNDTNDTNGEEEDAAPTRRGGHVAARNPTTARNRAADFLKSRAYARIWE